MPLDRSRLERLTASETKLIDIASELGCSTATVRYWLANGVSRVKTCGDEPPNRIARAQVAERQCATHGLTAFRLDRLGTYRCRRCRQQNVSERRRRVKRILVEKAGGCCELCGYDRFAGALQFHHRVRSEKSFAVSSRGLTRSIAAARAEAEKCVLLCANCHAEVEAGVRALSEAPRGGFEPPRTD